MTSFTLAEGIEQLVEYQKTVCDSICLAPRYERCKDIYAFRLIYMLFR